MHASSSHPIDPKDQQIATLQQINSELLHQVEFLRAELERVETELATLVVQTVNADVVADR